MEVPEGWKHSGGDTVPGEVGQWLLFAQFPSLGSSTGSVNY